MEEKFKFREDMVWKVISNGFYLFIRLTTVLVYDNGQ